MPTYQPPQSASREDIAEALTAPNPSEAVRRQLEALEALEDWIFNEKSKWTHAHELVELWSRTGSGTDDSQVRQTELEGVQPDADAANEDIEPAYTPTTRREAVLDVLATEPIRAWRLKDIITEMRSRGWSSQSQNEDNMVTRVLVTLKDANHVKRPKKGYYKLMRPPVPQESGHD